MVDLSKTIRPLPDSGVLQLLVSSQDQIRTEISNLAKATAAQGAKIDTLEKRSEEIQKSVNRIYEHNTDCPARAHFQQLREDLSQIRIMVSAHDRQLAEEQGYKTARRNKPTPWSGVPKVPSAPPGAVSLSLSIRDPKVWGKILFYTAVSAMAAASFIAQYF